MNFIIDENLNIISCSKDFSEDLEPMSFFDSDRLPSVKGKKHDYQTTVNGEEYNISINRIETQRTMFHFNISCSKKGFYENIYKQAIQAIATHKMVYNKKGEPVDYTFYDDLFYTKEFLTNIISNMPSMLIGVAANGLINEWNKRAVSLTGISYEEAVGKKIDQVLRFEYIADALETCEEKRKVVKLEKVKGLIYGKESLIFEILIYKLDEKIKDGYVLILRDITESIHLQEMMIQNEKMISVGGLAVGMAHEINNPISGILQGVQNIKRRLSPDNLKNIKSAEKFGIDLFELTEFLEDRKVDVFLDGIEEAGFRAANIISNMLQFSKKTGGERKKIRIKDLIERVYQLACNEFDLSKKIDFRKIKVDISRVSEDIHLHCVDTEIEQVLLNLVINSAHAVFRHRPENGRINFITKRKDDKILIEVEDNGPGIDASLRSRVFEPFFTTKKPGEGTGLGLSVAYFIVKEHHGGEIYVSGGHDQGARFTIILPGGRKDDR